MMLSKTKRFTLLFLSVILLLSLSATAAINYENVAQISLSMTFSGDTATCRTRVTGDEETTSIIAYISVYEVDTSDNTLTLVEDFPTVRSSSSYPRELNYVDYVDCEQGKTYYLTCTAHVTVNGVTEIVSESITKRYA